MTSTDFAQPNPSEEPKDAQKAEQTEQVSYPIDEAILRALRGQDEPSTRERLDAEVWRRERGFGKIEVWLSQRYFAGALRAVLVHSASYTRVSDGAHMLFRFVIDLPRNLKVRIPDEATLAELHQLEDQYLAAFVDPTENASDASGGPNAAAQED